VLIPSSLNEDVTASLAAMVTEELSASEVTMLSMEVVAVSAAIQKLHKQRTDKDRILYGS